MTLSQRLLALSIVFTSVLSFSAPPRVEIRPEAAHVFNEPFAESLFRKMSPREFREMGTRLGIELGETRAGTLLHEMEAMPESRRNSPEWAARVREFRSEFLTVPGASEALTQKGTTGTSAFTNELGRIEEGGRKKYQAQVTAASELYLSAATSENLVAKATTLETREGAANQDLSVRRAAEAAVATGDAALIKETGNMLDAAVDSTSDKGLPTKDGVIRHDPEAVNAVTQAAGLELIGKPGDRTTAAKNVTEVLQTPGGEVAIQGEADFARPLNAAAMKAMKDLLMGAEYKKTAAELAGRSPTELEAMLKAGFKGNEAEFKLLMAKLRETTAGNFFTNLIGNWGKRLRELKANTVKRLRNCLIPQLKEMFATRAGKAVVGTVAATSVMAAAGLAWSKLSAADQKAKADQAPALVCVNIPGDAQNVNCRLNPIIFEDEVAPGVANRPGQGGATPGRHNTNTRTGTTTN